MWGRDACNRRMITVRHQPCDTSMAQRPLQPETMEKSAHSVGHAPG